MNFKYYNSQKNIFKFIASSPDVQDKLSDH